MKVNKYPKVMEVSIYKDFRNSLKRVVFMYKNGMYLAWAGAATLEEADRELEVISWPYAREITPEIDITDNEQVLMILGTMQEILNDMQEAFDELLSNLMSKEAE